MPSAVSPSPAVTPVHRKAVVRWYSLAKGYGFARLPGDERDIFLHHSELGGGAPPEPGEEILLELGEGERGLYGARIVRPAAR